MVAVVVVVDVVVGNGLSRISNKLDDLVVISCLISLETLPGLMASSSALG